MVSAFLAADFGELSQDFVLKHTNPPAKTGT